VSTNLANLLYLVTIVTFILALRFLSSPAHARRGNQIGAVGMVIAIIVTWIKIGTTSWWAIVVAMAIGGGFGAVAARKVKMTAMPQMVALFNGVGGGAAALISLAELHRILPEPGSPKVDISLGIVLSALIGSISFAGSMVAFGKLQELIGGRPITYAGQQFVNGALFLGALACSIILVAGVQDEWLLWVTVGASLLFGVLFVLPIGGADMPVVISLLNAFTGLAVALGGFELENNVLIVSGMLVGASGTLLTLLMGRAMNRSIANVLGGGWGKRAERNGRGRRGHARLRAQGRVRPRLRARGCASAARRAAARRSPREQGRRGHVRDPSGRRAHARAYERPASGGERPVSAAEGDGRREPGVRAYRRCGGRRCERRREP
jgi:H+-translocating NAD(P) transhydrogenase subunit beta